MVWSLHFRKKASCQYFNKKVGVEPIVKTAQNFGAPKNKFLKRSKWNFEVGPKKVGVVQLPKK